MTPIALQNLLTMSSPQYSSRMTGNDLATTAGSTALGIGTNSYNIKKLQEQLDQATKEYQNLLSNQEYNKKVSMINSGWGTTKERAALIKELSGGKITTTGTSDLLGGGTGGAAVTDLTSMLKAANLATRYGEAEVGVKFGNNMASARMPNSYTDIASSFKNKLKQLLNS